METDKGEERQDIELNCQVLYIAGSLVILVTHKKLEGEGVVDSVDGIDEKCLGVYYFCGKCLL